MFKSSRNQAHDSCLQELGEEPDAELCTGRHQAIRHCLVGELDCHVILDFSEAPLESANLRVRGAVEGKAGGLEASALCTWVNVSASSAGQVHFEPVGSRLSEGTSL